jgi:hypothetical protein
MEQLSWILMWLHFCIYWNWWSYMSFNVGSPINLESKWISCYSSGLDCRGRRLIYTPQHSDWLWGSHCFLSGGYWGSSFVDSGAWSSPHTCNDCRDQEWWIYISTPPLCLHGQHRDFTLVLLIWCALFFELLVLFQYLNTGFNVPRTEYHIRHSFVFPQ